MPRGCFVYFFGKLKQPLYFLKTEAKPKITKLSLLDKKSDLRICVPHYTQVIKEIAINLASKPADFLEFSGKTPSTIDCAFNLTPQGSTRSYHQLARNSPFSLEL
jgi:hypothetical protein